MNILLVGPIKHNIDISELKFDKVIAIDNGVKFALDLNLHIDLAVGDFDSLTDKTLLKDIKKVITLNKEKDDTDFEYVLKLLNKEQNIENIYGIGLLYGNRLDHLFLNILLLYKYKNLNIELISNKCFIKLLNSGKHLLNQGKYKYISFFSLKQTTITLDNGFKYKVNNEIISMDELKYISNEFVDNNASLSIDDDIIVMYSSD